MCAWLTLDKPSREHIFSHFFATIRESALQQGKASTHPENIGMTRIFWWFICSVQSLGRVWLFETPWTTAPQASCPSPAPRVYSNSCPLSRWCHPIVSSSVIPFSCLQSFPASRSFPVSQFFASGVLAVVNSASVNTGVHISLSVLVSSVCMPSSGIARS